jgi:hypothetical protein
VLFGKLTQDQKAEILRRIRSKWTGRRECPICGTNKWEMSPHVVSSVTLRDLVSGAGAVEAMYPSVLLACDNCGNTLSFNLVILGIMPRDTDISPMPEEKGDV